MTPTKQQLAAIHAHDQHVVCLAPAGSGKTFVLTGRAMYLIDSGIDPSEVLCLTFTRRAASEMKKRIADRMGDRSEDLDRMWIGTVHSIALRIVELYGPLLGYQDTGISIIQPEDVETLMTECAVDAGLAKWAKKGLKKSLRWRSGLSAKKASEYLEAEYGRKDKSAWSASQQHELDKLVNRFHNRCRDMHALTFGLILRECDRLLNEHPHVLAELQARFRHVLVDECQDSSSVEFSLYERLSSGCHTFLVGDLRQSVYSFRDARPDMLNAWIEDKNAAVYDLENCFRCGDNIVEAANLLISRNEGDPGAPMVGQTGRPGTVTELPGNTDRIVDAIKELNSAFYSYAEIAIIGRRHATLGHIQTKLFDAGIPYQRVASKDSRQKTPAFRLIGACMRLAVNPHDEMAAVLIRDEIGIERSQWAELKAYATRTGDGIGNAMFAAYHESEMLRLVLDARNKRMSGSVFALRCMECLMKRHGSDAHQAFNAWSDLEPRPGASIGELMRAQALTDNEKGEDIRQKDAVTLITAHAAKGLEWPVVFIPCFNEGEYPVKGAVRSGDIEEERRIAYVAITRAREQLFIHYETEDSQRQRMEGQGFEFPVKPTSRFLSELNGYVELESVA